MTVLQPALARLLNLGGGGIQVTLQRDIGNDLGSRAYFVCGCNRGNTYFRRLCM